MRINKLAAGKAPALGLAWSSHSRNIKSSPFLFPVLSLSGQPEQPPEGWHWRWKTWSWHSSVPVSLSTAAKTEEGSTPGSAPQAWWSHLITTPGNHLHLWNLAGGLSLENWKENMILSRGHIMKCKSCCRLDHSQRRPSGYLFSVRIRVCFWACADSASLCSYVPSGCEHGLQSRGRWGFGSQFCHLTSL